MAIKFIFRLMASDRDSKRLRDLLITLEILILIRALLSSFQSTKHHRKTMRITHYCPSLAPSCLYTFYTSVYFVILYQ